MKKSINIKLEKTAAKMANLRKGVRRAIQAGNEIYAIVLEVYLNKATVRLEHTNQKLTGLMILGGDVEIGDRVIVDYSHGTPPFIRSSYISDQEKADIELNIYKDKYISESLPPSVYGYGDSGTLPDREIAITAAVNMEHYNRNTSQKIQYAVPTVIRWGDNKLIWGSWYYAQLWDSGSIWPYTNVKDPYGSESLSVPGGKYIVRVYMDWSIPNMYDCNPLFHGFTPEKRGWLRLTILQQGSPIAQVSQRWGAIPSPYNEIEAPMYGLYSKYYSWIGKSIACSAIAEVTLSNPGLFTVQIEQTVCANDDFDTFWMFPFQWNADFSITLIPGSYRYGS